MIRIKIQKFCDHCLEDIEECEDVFCRGCVDIMRESHHIALAYLRDTVSLLDKIRSDVLVGDDMQKDILSVTSDINSFLANENKETV